jgi:hypothetical protein
MIFQAFILALSAWLVTGPLSEPGQIFASILGRIRSLLAPPGKDPKGLRYVMYQWVSCAKCLAGIVALVWQSILLWQGSVTLWEAFAFWVMAVGGAAILEKEYS